MHAQESLPHVLKKISENKLKTTIQPQVRKTSIKKPPRNLLGNAASTAGQRDVNSHKNTKKNNKCAFSKPSYLSKFSLDI